MPTFPVESPHSGHRKTQYTIKTNGVSYEVSPSYFSYRFKVNHTQKKQILKDVNCEIKPAAITAVAGPSGAGKSTLLEILAGVIHPRRISGYVVVNDQPMNPTVFRRVSGYIPQEDLLFPLLTVEETLLYSARLRLQGGLANAKKRVSKLLLELGLSHVAGERIGGFSSRTNRGISGGEKRRVSIGVDLVHDPGVLLMDEPTSGLDSTSALQLMLMLKTLAKDHGKTIVLTIHQPGFRILELFNQVVLLVDGTVVHLGSLDQLEHRLKLAGHCIANHVNVLEFSIEMIKTLNITDVELESGFDMVAELLDDRVNDDRYHRFKYANSQLTEMVILSERFCYNIFRTKDLLMSKMVQSVVVGILLGTTFKNVNRFEMQTQLGFFAFNLSFLIYSSSEALPIFLEERKILMKETSIGAYRVSSYILANTLVFIPFLLIVALLYAVPTYWLVGLRGDIDGFLYFSLVVWLVLLMSNSFVACFSSLVSSFMVGIALLEGLMGTFFLFSGYFISKNDIPGYWIWVHYLSLVKYPFESFLINEFGRESGRWRCLNRHEDGCLMNGEEFLKNQNLEDIQKWYNLGIMLVFIIGYRFLSLLVLYYRSYKSRN
ncbi:putative ABC transporter, AAA+ ATPase domain, ABC-2 type transporter [Helianthus annuus]|nr:putative ABC transporter, AAA+ ATPase domain, ABC-2 type transporter [Helianthus annuus]